MLSFIVHNAKTQAYELNSNLKNKCERFFLTAKNLKLFGKQITFLNDPFQSYYDYTIFLQSRNF